SFLSSRDSLELQSLHDPAPLQESFSMPAPELHLEERHAGTQVCGSTSSGDVKTMSLVPAS
ncbi:mCG144604, partial [Mus musculus]